MRGISRIGIEHIPENDGQGDTTESKGAVGSSGQFDPTGTIGERKRGPQQNGRIEQDEVVHQGLKFEVRVPSGRI